MKKIWIRFRRYLLFCLIKALHVFPIDSKKIIIVSYWGKGYGDNGKAIVNALHSKGCNYTYYWAISKKTKCIFPEYVTPVRYLSLPYYYHLATAKIWIDNSRKSVYVTKRTGQYYIQTWHGDPMLKKIEKDAEGVLSPDYVAQAKQDSKLADLVLANSDFGINFFKTSFWYTGEVYKSGSPRLDILYTQDSQVRFNIRSKLHIPKTRKILLYAPTFRANHDISCYSLDYFMLYDTLTKIYKCEWTILVRLHPNMLSEEIASLNLPNYTWLIDVSKYDDMYELLCISNILITDYSSTMFEAASAKIPVFLFATDLPLYMNDRGTYFEYKGLPFPIAETFAELISLIKTFNMEQYLSQTDDFCKSLGVVRTGHSSELVANRIIDVIEN